MFNISNYFQSAKFKEQIAPIYEKLEAEENTPDDKYNSFKASCDQIIGAAVTFYQMFMFKQDFGPEVEELFYTYMDEVVEKYKNKHYFQPWDGYNPIIEKYFLKVNKDKLANKSQEEIEKLLVSEIIDKSCIYHAFNSNFEESIRKNGINPNHKVVEQEELDKVNSIVEKYSTRPLFGLQKSCAGRVYYATTSHVSSDYAYGPEWFGKACGSRFFEKNDYASAKEHFVLQCVEMRMSLEDMDVVVGFFDDCWAKFANFTPKLAMLPNYQLDKEFQKEVAGKMGISSFDAWDYYCLGCYNESTEETIPVDEAEIIDLPNIPQLIKEMDKAANKDNENLQEQTEIKQAETKYTYNNEPVM